MLVKSVFTVISVYETKIAYIGAQKLLRNLGYERGRGNNFSILGWGKKREGEANFFKVLGEGTKAFNNMHTTSSFIFLILLQKSHLLKAASRMRKKGNISASTTLTIGIGVD